MCMKVAGYTASQMFLPDICNRRNQRKKETAEARGDFSLEKLQEQPEKREKPKQLFCKIIPVFVWNAAGAGPGGCRHRYYCETEWVQGTDGDGTHRGHGDSHEPGNFKAF